MANAQAKLVRIARIDSGWRAGFLERKQRQDVAAKMQCRHQGGAHVLMADGAVKFITDSIEAGNVNASARVLAGVESPFGLWGALGTRGSNEVIDTEF